MAARALISFFRLLLVVSVACPSGVSSALLLFVDERQSRREARMPQHFVRGLYRDPLRSEMINFKQTTVNMQGEQEIRAWC